MFIRGPEPASVIWHHFRTAGDGFAFGTRDGLFEAQLVPNADRTIELLLALFEYLTPAGDLFVEDWRSGEHWRGEDLAMADVRDAIARSKQALAAHAGTEITVVSGREQVTLTANLELYIFADTDRWLYLLQGLGLHRVPRLRQRSWRMRRGEFPRTAAAESAVRLTVERLHLVRASDTTTEDAG